MSKFYNKTNTVAEVRYTFYFQEFNFLSTISVTSNEDDKTRKI